MPPLILSAHMKARVNVARGTLGGYSPSADVARIVQIRTSQVARGGKRATAAPLLYRQDGKFMNRTDGPDGALHDFKVKFTFGVAPLEQYRPAAGFLDRLGSAA
jgi:hypothetical protein